MAEKIDSKKIPDEDADPKADEDPNEHFPYTDVGLEVEGKILYVAKSILINKSPVFKTMFESDFQEKSMKVVPLPDKKHEDISLFLKCLCPFISHPITVDNVMQILPLASEYIAKEIIAKCEDIICDHCAKCSSSLGSNKGTDNTKILVRRVLDYLISYETFHLDRRVLLAVSDVACYIDCATLENYSDYKSLNCQSKWIIATKRLTLFENKCTTQSTFQFSSEDDTAVSRVFKFLFQFKNRIL